MRLAEIREIMAHDKEPERMAFPTPRTVEDTGVLFRKGLRAMADGNDEEAFRILDYLSRYEGDALTGLVDGARIVRDFVDPNVSPTQKAKRFFDLFPGRIVHIYDAHQGLRSSE
jgi:hypothetical protein